MHELQAHWGSLSVQPTTHEERPKQRVLPPSHFQLQADILIISSYIKELADRLTRLEYEQQQNIGHSPQNGQHHTQVPELQSYLQSMGDQGMAGLTDFSASPAPPYGAERKRTHSMSEGPGDQFRTSLSQPPNGAPQSWDRREPFATGYEHDAAGAFFEFSQSADVAVNE